MMDSKTQMAIRVARVLGHYEGNRYFGSQDARALLGLLEEVLAVLMPGYEAPVAEEDAAEEAA